MMACVTNLHKGLDLPSLSAKDELSTRSDRTTYGLLGCMLQRTGKH